MKKRLAIIILIIILAIAFAIIFAIQTNDKNPNTGSNTQNTNNSSDDELDFYLNGFPKDQIPFHKLTEFSSFKYFVNDDPQNYDGYFGKKHNYYNIVFKSEASKDELLNYYKDFFDEDNSEAYSTDTVRGTVGKYKVSVSHYDSDKTAYMEVHLPQNEFNKDNKYYADYPKLIDPDKEWTERENSYGVLAQKGGEIEYTQYFSLDSKKIQEYVEKYSEILKDKDGFKSQNNTLSWKEDGYTVTMSFVENQKRVFLMIRKSVKG